MEVGFEPVTFVKNCRYSATAQPDNSDVLTFIFQTTTGFDVSPAAAACLGYFVLAT